MRAVRIESDKITSGDNITFPDVIYFEQDRKYDSNNTEYEKVRGTFGYSYHNYGIELGKNIEVLVNKINKSKERNNSTASNRSIALEYLKTNYSCFEINDYGTQATSDGYNDIFIQVYRNNGTKVPQKDIGFIRNFSSKKVLVIVNEKNINEPIIFVYPLTRYNIIKDENNNSIRRGSFPRSASRYIFKDTDSADISENVLYFGTFNNGLDSNSISEITLIEPANINNTTVNPIESYSYNNYSIKGTNINSHARMFTKESKLKTPSYNLFLSNSENTNITQDDVKIGSKSLESNGKSYSTKVESDIADRDKYEAEYYDLEGKYINKGQEIINNEKICYFNSNDISEIDYNLADGHRVEICARANGDIEDGNISEIIASLLYSANIYRWNIKSSECFYKLFIGGYLVNNNSNNLKISENSKISLIIYDNSEKVENVSVSLADKFIILSDDILENNNKFFNKNINTNNLIKTNPYLNVLDEFKGYNDEYFVHNIETEFVPYEGELVKDNEYIFAYNIDGKTDDTTAKQFVSNKIKANESTIQNNIIDGVNDILTQLKEYATFDTTYFPVLKQNFENYIANSDIQYDEVSKAYNKDYLFFYHEIRNNNETDNGTESINYDDVVITITYNDNTTHENKEKKIKELKYNDDLILFIPPDIEGAEFTFNKPLRGVK